MFLSEKMRNQDDVVWLSFQHAGEYAALLLNCSMYWGLLTDVMADTLCF